MGFGIIPTKSLDFTRRSFALLLIQLTGDVDVMCQVTHQIGAGAQGINCTS